MEEILRGGGKYYISKKDLVKMKNNMKKVPLIQKKSEEYHKNQNIQADEFIDKSLDTKEEVSRIEPVVDVDNKKNTKIGFRKLLINKIKSLLLKNKNGN